MSENAITETKLTNMQVYKNEDLILERFEVGPFMVNAYILGCLKTSEAAIIDPGDEGDRILKRCEELNLTPKFILNTHGHADHIIDNRYVKEKSKAQIVIHALDADMLTDAEKNRSVFFGMPLTSLPADLQFKEGENFTVGEISLEVLLLPGHSPGSVCLFHDPIAIVGDVLFAGSIGRTDFPGGSYEMLVNNIRTKLLPLGDHVLAFPGHGPETTLGQERRTNPFLNDSIFG
jgi:glyoxylase-like metal-dependent hydrolase (beta-lactamase superfamily II)